MLRLQNVISKSHNMKKAFLLSFSAVMIAFSGFSQGEFGFGYANSTPQGLMSRNIRSIHSFVMDYGVRMKQLPLYVGLNMSFGTYGNSSNNRWYEFPDGTGMLAPVSVSNSVIAAGLQGRYEVPADWSLKPYASASAGMSHFKTRLTIEDPREIHTNECPVPLEDEVLKADNSWFTGLGLGLRLDLSTIMKNSMEKGIIFFDFSAHYLRGSTVEYMSVNAPDPTIAAGFNPENVSSVTLDFASAANPEIIHKYHTGYLYRTPMELIDYRFRIVFVIPN
jgi:hypothetical protein